MPTPRHAPSAPFADAWESEPASADKTNGSADLDLVPGRLYDRRKEIHGYYGGQMQGGISTPKNHPVVLLFTGEEGHDYGYRDGFREDGIFDYTGEGQTGDMMMKGGNRAIHDHDADRKQLLLFQSAGPGKVRFLGQCHYLGHRHEPALDKDKKPRRAIVFELEIEARHGSGAPRDFVVDTDEPESPDLWKLSLDRLRRRALNQAKAGAPAKERKVLLRQRSEAVRVYALRRAGGVCEGCGENAPFLTAAGRGYLEVHHIQRLADSGPDDPSAVVAICPNCHRRVHHGADGAEYNAFLAGKASKIEAALS